MKALVEAARGRRPSRRPVWFMRQAGRYLPEYREVRAKVGFLELCKSPKLAAEVTLQPLRRYDLDAAIIFSDILVPCVALGQDLTFGPGEGPRLAEPIRSAAALSRLRRPDAQKDLGYVGDAIVETKKGLAPHQAMIGFAGAPFTVASYMIEGEGSKTFTEVKRLLFKDRGTFDGLMALLGEVTIEYLRMQIRAGADVVMLFDTWAANLASRDYVEAVWPVTRRVLSTIRGEGTPVFYFPGQGSDRMADLAGAELDVVSVDWRTPLARAGALLKAQGLDVTLQGNLDPQILVAPEPVVRERTRQILAEGVSAARAHIFNVGHGLLPHTPPEALGWVLDEIRKGGA